MGVIQMHATWLAVNSIVGCTNGCKYCFLQSENNNLNFPKVLESEKKSIEELLNSKFYNSTIPVCLLPNTDPFLSHDNIEYLKNLLKEVKERDINNPIIIITKCYIPIEFINFIKNLDMMKQIVVYLSYSGLGKEFEPNVNHEDIKQNFINLYNNGIKIVHYFRPITPFNGSKEKINETLSFVNQYTKYSVITGLKIKPSFYDKIDFWPEIREHKEEVIKAEGVWPKEGYYYIYNELNLEHYIFQTNFCALSAVLNKASTSYYDTFECNNCNKCSKEQRELCKENARKSINKKNLEKELKKIGVQSEKIEFEIKKRTILLKEIELTVGDVSYLTQTLQRKIIVSNKKKNDDYFNSSLVGAKPFLIGGNNKWKN